MERACFRSKPSLFIAIFSSLFANAANGSVTILTLARLDRRKYS